MIMNRIAKSPLGLTMMGERTTIAVPRYRTGSLLIRRTWCGRIDI